MNQAASLSLSGRFSGSRFSASQESEGSSFVSSVLDSRLQFPPSPERERLPEEEEAATFAPLVPEVQDAPVNLSSTERAIALMNASRPSDWSEMTGVYKNNFVDANCKDQVPSKCARYVGSGKNPQYLMAHCIGLKADEGEDSRMLGDPKDPIYGAVDRPTKFFPTVPILKEEMLCRIEQKGLKKEDRPKNMSYFKRHEIVSWLKENPLGNQVDIDHVLFYEGSLYETLVAADTERKETERKKLANMQWSKPHPYLRLYCCFCDDETRVAFARRDDSLTRAALDGRNNENRPETVYEVVARLYNSDKVYWTDPLPNLHSIFGEPIQLVFAEMPGGAITPQEVKERWGDARAKTVQVRQNAACK